MARKLETTLITAIATAAALAATGASAQPGDGPVWVRRPSQADLERNYPNVTGAGAGGSVALRCKVTDQGSLTNCAVAAESPTGLGFGGAALSVARSFKMKPLTTAGRPVAGATVVVPVKFELAGGTVAPELNIRPGDAAILVTQIKGAPSKRDAVIPCPSASNPNRQCAGHTFAWRNRASASTVGDLLAGSDQRTGVSLVECSAAADGTLSACKIGGEATDKSKEALLKMAPMFRAPSFANDSTPMSSGRVLIEVDWSLINPWLPAS